MEKKIPAWVPRRSSNTGAGAEGWRRPGRSHDAAPMVMLQELTTITDGQLVNQRRRTGRQSPPRVGSCSLASHRRLPACLTLGPRRRGADVMATQIGMLEAIRLEEGAEYRSWTGVRVVMGAGQDC